MSKAGVSGLAAFRPLDREEIENRMDTVARALAGPSEAGMAEEVREGEKYFYDLRMPGDHFAVGVPSKSRSRAPSVRRRAARS